MQSRALAWRGLGTTCSSPTKRRFITRKTSDSARACVSKIFCLLSAGVGGIKFGDNIRFGAFSSIIGAGAVFLEGADLTEANLTGANLTEAHLVGANLRKANLTDTNLSGADLTGANLSGAHPEAAKSLTGTKMYGVSGLTKEQCDACKNKGARIEESSGGPGQASILQVN